MSIFDICDRCEHGRQIEDTSQGDFICLDCGLVMDPVFRFKDNNIQSDKNNDFIIEEYCQEQETNKNKKCEHLKQEKDILLTLCDKLHLNKSVKHSISEVWDKIKDWHYINARKVKTDKKGLIVMAVYNGLMIENVPRPVSHLCQELEVHPKIVWRWIKLYKSVKSEIKTAQTRYVKATDMCEYFLKPLNLTYKEIQNVQERIKRNENSSFAPKTLTAACAYTFLKETRAQFPSVRDLSRLLGISVMSVYRCCKTLKSEKEVDSS